MNKKVCTRCLLRDMDEDLSQIQKYKDAIKMEDRVSEERYEDRLNICKNCDKLHVGTCLSCGCYVELRAVATVAHCPNRKW